MGLFDRHRRQASDRPVANRQMVLPADTNPIHVLDVVVRLGKGVGLDDKNRMPRGVELGRRSLLRRLTGAPASQYLPLRIWVQTAPQADQLVVLLKADDDGHPEAFGDERHIQQYLDASLLELSRAIMRELNAEVVSQTPTQRAAPPTRIQPSTPSPAPRRPKTKSDPSSDEPMPRVKVDGGGVSVTFTISGPSTEPRPAPVEDAAWYPPGELAMIGEVMVADGMVYVGTVRKDSYSMSGNGIIDPSLKVELGPAPAREPDIGYYPSYHGLTPHQRGAYLMWLSRGRADPLDEQAYLFLFLNGLERRVLSDMDVREGIGELLAISHEVRRLVELYQDKGSFVSYSSSFLELIAVLLLAQGAEAPDGWERRVHWALSTKTRIEVAVAAKQGLPLSAELALALVRIHPEARLRTPAERCVTEFDELFGLRYKERFGDGLPLQNKKAKPMSVSHFASARNIGFHSFVFHHSALGSADEDGPTVDLELVEPTRYDNSVFVRLEDLPAAISMEHLQLELIELAGECQDALAKFSRYLASKDADPSSERAQSLLPPDLVRSRRAPVSAQIDLEVVADLLAEDAVSILLAERLTSSDDESGVHRGPPAGAQSGAESDGLGEGVLDELHRLLAQRLAERTLWSKGEATQLASTLGFTFLGPAVARINEMALDTVGSLLFIGEDPLEVDHEIYEEMSW